jgi:hypothetical protein
VQGGRGAPSLVRMWSGRENPGKRNREGLGACLTDATHPSFGPPPTSWIEMRRGVDLFCAKRRRTERNALRCTAQSVVLTLATCCGSSCCGHPTEGDGCHRSAQQSAQTKDPSRHSAAEKAKRRQRERAEAITTIRSHVWNGSEIEMNSTKRASNACCWTAARFVRLPAVVE